MRAFLSLVIFLLSSMSVGAAPLSHDQLAALVMLSEVVFASLSSHAVLG